jgi:hypothetical protein
LKWSAERAELTVVADLRLEDRGCCAVAVWLD